MKKYVFKNKILLLAWALSVLATTGSNVLMAYFVNESVKNATDGTTKGAIKLLILGVSFMFFVFFGTFFENLFMNKFSKNTIRSIRKDIFSKIFSLSENSYEEFKQAKFLSILTNDTKQAVDDYYCMYPSMISFILLMLASMGILFSFSYKLVAIDLVTSIIVFFCPKFLDKKIERLFKKITEGNERLLNTSKDFLHGFNVIKNYHSERKIIELYNNDNENLAKDEMRGKTIRGLSWAISSGLSWLVYVVHYFLSIVLVIRGEVSIAGMVASAQVVMYIVNPIEVIGSIRARIIAAKPAVKRINELLNIKEEDRKLIHIDEILPIEFKKVTFSYDEKKILDECDLDIQRNKKYLLIGASGSGKSTLMKLMDGYYENYSGKIYLNGFDQSQTDRISINDRIAYIQQEAMIFCGSIKDNITMFSECEKNAIDKVVKEVELNELLEKVEGDYNFNIEEAGKNISGGERQRIALARALFKNKEIMLLDEATSNLDIQSRGNIERKLLSKDNLTLVTISHNCDRDIMERYDEILFMKGGRIVERGSYEDLMDKKGLFYSFCLLND